MFQPDVADKEKKKGNADNESPKNGGVAPSPRKEGYLSRREEDNLSIKVSKFFE